MNPPSAKPRIRSLLATLHAGFEPAGAVMGAGTYQVMPAASCLYFTAQMYEDALRGMWADVILRIEDEAARAEAHGVVGVYATESYDAAGPNTLQLQLTGTAVRVTDADRLDRPFLSMLGLDDTLKLIGRGWIPSGVVVGISAEHVHGWGASPLLQGTALSNAEMEAPTLGMQAARHRAELHARQALRAARAEGLVAPDITINRSAMGCSSGGGQGMLILGRVLGTGVVRFAEPVLPVQAVRSLT